MSTSLPVTILEQCRVAPRPATVAETTIPLTFLDLPYLHDPLIHHLFFYEIPGISLAHFEESIAPTLKDSLSLTLQHYFPLAGNLILRRESGEPHLSYAGGDSVLITFAELAGPGFDHLTGNHARNVARFHALVPPLPPMCIADGDTVAPLMAVQVTLFPGAGFCIGFTLRRVTGDGGAFTSFIRFWASVSKTSGNGALPTGSPFPVHDRSIINDDHGLGPIFLSQICRRKFDGSESQLKPTDNVIATFQMGPAHIHKLKKWASAQCPHVSTFTVVCAYIWSCRVKARAQSREPIKDVDKLETDHFVFLADIRALLNPPISDAYFGNCVARCIASVETHQLLGEGGFVIAAEAIWEAIRETLRNEEKDPLRGAEGWVSRIQGLKKDRVMGIAGSPRFAVYEMDFGWGRPTKSEVISIDVTGSMSLNECRDPNAGLEIGLSLSQAQMETFNTIFCNGLEALC